MRASWLVVLASAGCLRQTEFHCQTSAQCGPNGTCIPPVGFCAFPDTSCGERFGPQAGAYANACVGAGPGIDAPPKLDAPAHDGLIAPPDAPPGAANPCPATSISPPSASANSYFFGGGCFAITRSLILS